MACGAGLGARTRGEFVRLVWNEAMSKLAGRFEVSPGEFRCIQSSLDFFRSWPTPKEPYRPPFPKLPSEA